jgi:hypothetical protein
MLGAYFLRDAAQPLLVSREQDEPPASPSERPRDCCTDPARAARNDGDSVYLQTWTFLRACAE